MLRAYICYSCATVGIEDRIRVLDVCRAAAASSVLPIAPLLYLPLFVEGSIDAGVALRMRLELVASSDEIWQYGEAMGVAAREIEHARALKKLVRRIA